MSTMTTALRIVALLMRRPKLTTQLEIAILNTTARCTQWHNWLITWGYRMLLFSIALNAAGAWSASVPSRKGGDDMQLRDYQVEAREAILNEWKLGRQKTLLVLPTGCG